MGKLAEIKTKQTEQSADIDLKALEKLINIAAKGK